MPCFKGLAVSIHTPDGPLEEYSIQRQARFSRITSYIPVPPAKVPEKALSNRPEQSTFAISITLLVPGQAVPYSAPKPTESDRFPRPKTVSSDPGYSQEDRRQAVHPYVSLTSSPNETVAAYIYFDGRGKEEVATLLRRGEETWVNSRWVSVPESEGGGLAEREFLFREVGLERWLNGLDLEGKDTAAKIERRKQRMEKKRRQKEDAGRLAVKSDEMEVEDGGIKIKREDLSEETGGASPDPPSPASATFSPFSDSESDSEDDPVPETTGQIKVALFRVLASGEVKRGEYSPQFGAHDDDDEARDGETTKKNGDAGDAAEIDHTTSFAKPKTLDPSSISTQTVTGIDGPDRPYAVFTFLYRGERQLQKMGILPPSKVQEKTTATSNKRRSVPTDYSKLGPLKTGGTVGFSAFRDGDVKSPKLGSKSRTKQPSKPSDSDEEDDDDTVNDDADDLIGKIEDVDPKDEDKSSLTVEDAERQGELAEGLRQIKLKRAHSAEPLADAPRKTPNETTPIKGQSPEKSTEPGSTTPGPLFEQSVHSQMPGAADQTSIGSPLKRAKPSLPGLDDESSHGRLHLSSAGILGDVLGTSRSPVAASAPKVTESRPNGGVVGGSNAAEDDDEL
ncbi:MAG: hypothetical protein M1825_000849 [Sarcosagium campestre]|nr:MAG: hypothetical protein M1825_000849 [Sarcosagium campestre]